MAKKALVSVWKPATTLTGGPDVSTEETITIEDWEYNQSPWCGDVARCIVERSGNTMRFIRWIE